MFGVESQPLLGGSKRKGRDSVPSSLAVVESLTAFQSPVVGRFDLVSHAPDSLRESLVHYSRAVRSGLE